MTVKIDVTYERKERDVITYTLTSEQYAQFLDLRKSHNTAELGEWIENNVKQKKVFDCYGGETEIVTLYNYFEDEYIQD